MKLTYSLLPINRRSMQLNIHDDQRPPMCRFDGQIVPIDAVVSLLVQSGMTTVQIAEWIEQRMDIENLVPLTEVIQ